MTLDKYILYRSATQKAYPFVNVVALFTTCRSFVPTIKDTLPALSRSSVIYKFVCGCGHNYIGRTETQLHCRIKQHIPKWLADGRKTRPRSNKPPDSSIAKHLITCNFQLDRVGDCFSNLHCGHGYYKNKIIEAIEINTVKPSLCVQKDRLFQLKIPWQ